MSEQYTGKRVVTGSQGMLYWNNVPVLSVVSVEVGVELERSDVYIGMDKDSKLNGIGGTISLSVDHAFSRATELLKELKAGRDPRVLLSFVIKDPDAMGGQIERVNIANCWFNSFPLTSFSKGEHVTHDYDLGYRVTADSEFAQAIL